MRDELSLLIKSRGVRAAIAKYREELEDVFTVYCRADRVLAAGINSAAVRRLDRKSLSDRPTGTRPCWPFKTGAAST